MADIILHPGYHDPRDNQDARGDLLGTVVADVAGEAAKICSGVVYGFGAATDEDKAAFAALRNALDEALAGTRLAKDRAAKALATIMIPEALDYPM